MNNEQQRSYYHQNKDRILARRKQLYREKYPDIQRTNSGLGKAEYQRGWNLSNPSKYMLNNVRSRARREGTEFNLVEEDIVIPKTCKYLGVPLTFILGQGTVESNMSLDRIDPTKGYVKDNVQVISKKANTMKSNASLQELIVFARSVLVVHT